MMSMDQADRESFKAGASPFETPGEEVELVKVNDGAKAQKYGLPESVLSLNGEWMVAEEGSEKERLNNEWNDAFSAEVPCSIHMALFKAGRIPDPNVGRNQLIAREYSYKTWWLKKTFAYEPYDGVLRLEFNGIANKCSVWLNGEFLCEHEGMFGGPFIDVTGRIKNENTLIVKLEPIPHDHDGFNSSNSTWNKTVVINNVYGWHYSNLESIGIWNTVSLIRTPKVELSHPFIAARDYKQGLMDLLVPLKAQKAPWSGKLSVTIAPRNFEGDTYCYEEEIRSDSAELEKRYAFRIPDFRLWWPVDLGEQNLYELNVRITSGGDVSEYKSNFGIRHIEMAPLPEGPKPELYNWMFLVNGRKSFIKGSNWCTIDALLDFKRERYDRFLSLARNQHVQLLRAWGCGMPESDDFYDLCDLYGIMVMQEWPTAWNSHETQPYDMLEDVVVRHTLRLRNHPSLVIYCAGNESPDPFGSAIDMMGRLSIELDGTRTYHRGEPFGGSRHDYNVYWARKHMDFNLTVEASFWGEFGLASYPSYESMMKYLPEDEKKRWPPERGSGFEYHTPIFGVVNDMDILAQYAEYFAPENSTLEKYIIGSQLAQGMGVKPVLERSRTRFPECTGALYYKLNDNAPSATWSSIDWYGAPKLSYYIIQDAFEPLHVCVLFDRMNFSGTPQSLPVFLLDDSNELAGNEWKVTVRVFDSQLCQTRSLEFSGSGCVDAPYRLGELNMDRIETRPSPIFIVCDIEVNGELKHRNYYMRNYEYRKGCLFDLPRASLTYERKENTVIVKNIGKVPAVGLTVSAPGKSNVLTVSDNFFWLDANESKAVTVNVTGPISVDSLNSI